MIPKRVLLENFLSFGEPAVEIEFTDNEPLWVICGPNGVGKSAIFDAVTYALFACHRGGARNAEQLIHHGASGFRVELDFEINGRDFRISRTKATRTTQKVFSRIPGTDEWTPEHIGNAAPDVKKWVEANIGLEFEAFKASVLLRQGEADAILTATGSERLALLKTIIGADRFERISGRIHEDLKEYKDELERLHETLDNAPLVSDEELAAARTALIEAEQHRQKMQELSARANESLAGAKQWSTLQLRKANLERIIREAEERVNRATQIQGDKARLDLLSSIVPKLRTILELRDKVARSETELATENLQNSDLSNLCEINQKAADAVVQVLEMSRAQAERFDQAARGLREEIARDNKSLAIAQDLSNLREEWKAFPADLTQSLERAEKELLAATLDAQRAGETKAANHGLLKQALARQMEFAKVGVDVPCSLCGQIVDRLHAANERDNLGRHVRDLQEQYQLDERAAKQSEQTKQLCEENRERLAHLEQQRALVLEKLRTLESFGVSGDVSAIQQQLNTKEQAISEHERLRDDAIAKQEAAEQEKVRLERERGELETTAANLKNRIRSLELTNAANVSQWKTLLEQIPPDWQELVKTLDGHGIDNLNEERARLETLGIPEAFEKLQQDAARIQEWTKQLQDTTLDMEGIAVDSRLSVEEVLVQNRSVAIEMAAAERARDDAKTRMDDLNRRQGQQREIAALARTAERRLDLQRKLDELMGKKGLLRELVRTAERDIVAYAKDTLDKLSDGDLTLELAVEDDVDTAFDLRVRRADDSTPIGVSFLSGSQKFRVAVSIALAIGRFASGQARPLEAVIIDEGFGSLDRDGLRAMAEELNHLRAFLRRIVLVSHQEEFTDRFPVGIRLSASQHGTVAEPFRR